MQDIRFNTPKFNSNEAGLVNNVNTPTDANPLTFSSKSIANFNIGLNNNSQTEFNTYTWNGGGGSCDTPTINDHCLTIRGCGGLTNDANCGWTTFGSKCGCSHWSWFACGA